MTNNTHISTNGPTTTSPDDLCNGPHKLCECESPGCGCPILPPKKLDRA